MGQYFKGCVLTKNWKDSKRLIEFSCNPLDFDNGMKLMEHSYVGNNYVNIFEILLSWKYYGYPFVWTGDYADEIVNKHYDKIYVDIDVKNLCGHKDERTEKDRKTAEEILGIETWPNADRLLMEIPFDEDTFNKLGKLSFVYASHGVSLFEKAPNNKVKETPYAYFKYAVNFDKKEYVVIPQKKPNKWVIHPLPILCADSNGRGGGDYYGENEEMAGRWAYDHIGVTNDKKAIKGFTKIEPNFKEE